MWKILYNLLTFLLFVPYCFYILISGKTKGSLIERVFPRFKSQEEKVWVHSSSLGEASLSLLLVRFLISQRPELKFVLTANTNYARDFLKERQRDFEVKPPPLDTFFSVRRFLDKGKIRCLILIETEIWPNMIWESKRKGIKVILVNARLSQKSYRFYSFFSFFFRNVLKGIDLIASQSEGDRERFLRLGVKEENVFLLGNMKYLSYEVKGEIPRERAVTFGSVREKEIDRIGEVIVDLAKKYRDLRFYLAPREKDQFSKVFGQLKDKIETERYSVIKRSGSRGERLVIVDTFGDLRELYGRALVSFVGGSLSPYGGHNPIEPLVYGTPVIFGPYVYNFEDICREITEEGAGFMVKDFLELRKRIEELMQNEDLRKEMGRKGKKLLERKKREVETRLEEIKRLI